MFKCQKVGPNVQFLMMETENYKIAENSSKWSKMAKWKLINTKIAENSSKWSKMAKNGQTSKSWSQCAVP